MGEIMINEHINALNRAYALIDNKIDSLSTREQLTGFLDEIESQSLEPYMDILYSHAYETIKQKLGEL
jgi:hypothetical protein